MITNTILFFLGAIIAPVLLVAKQPSRIMFALGCVVGASVSGGIAWVHLGMLLIGFLGGPLVLLALVALLAVHIAKGESDINGDPEKDGGILPDPPITSSPK